MTFNKGDRPLNEDTQSSQQTAEETWHHMGMKWILIFRHICPVPQNEPETQIKEHLTLNLQEIVYNIYGFL